MTIRPFTRALVTAAIIGTFALAAAASAQTAAEKKPDYARVVPLLAVEKNIVGETIVYPTGSPAKITSAIVTLAPGESTGRHKHGVPTYGYILSGAVTVDYGNYGRRVYHAGTAFMEAMDIWHDGFNEGTEPCRILVVFMGSETAKNVVRK